MSHLGQFGDLKQSAAQPGPGAYDISQPLDKRGFHFSSANRKTGLDAFTDENIQREVEFQSRTAAGDQDVLDRFMNQRQQQHYQHQHQQQHQQQDAPSKPVLTHEMFIKQLSAMPRLLNGNVFPAASRRAPVIPRSKLSGDAPWEVLKAKGQHSCIGDRKFFHQPNEFSDLIAASARMGLPMMDDEVDRREALQPLPPAGITHVLAHRLAWGYVPVS
eukprot:CAMPEP_0183358686 /NCGR_PEP_ID=MMETSP0164_2-20130417/49957_1 /TAXON_ID=221442 /ORGANISM="Coccolithus pelagicus ssp braarudi, Strain PLY182g" /LENGTH=216 /DNA_ID=CAMNT_0025532625 /DNA_START=11 /DNA_END=662 /DNA_ORIENTATION=+